MKNFKKLMSLLLAFALVLSLCPMGFAADDAENGEITAEETVPGEEVEIVPMPDAEYEDTPTDETEPGQPADDDGTSDKENPGEPEDPEGESQDSEKKESEETEEPEESDEDEERLFPGMPEGYVLSAKEMARKQALNDNDVLTTLSEAVPGVDYVDGEVFFLADTAEYAQMVAAAYGATLSSCDSGVAVITLNGASVLDAVTVAADMSNNMPVVEADYISEIIPVIDVENGDSSLYAYRDESGISVKGSWKAWLETVGDNADVYLKDPAGLYQYMHDVVNTYEAWGVTKGKGVTVAVVDSGVAEHPDLNNNVVARVSVNEEWKNLEAAHGTHVAGIVAAEMGNKIGGAGIAPEAKIYGVRVFQNSTGSRTNIIRGVNKVIEAKETNPSIKVMDMSLGGPEYSVSYEDKIREAVNAGITVVAAMGNNGTNIRSYPAAFDIPGIIAVQSSNKVNTMSYFSNYGAWADVTAPGSYILSTLFDASGATYGQMSGTSMATPVVSGLCALYLSVYPDATPVQVEAAIKKATTNGIVDASKLFKNENKAPTIESEKTPDSSGALPYGSKLTITAADSSETIIYTVNGKAPSIVNGVATGTAVPSDELELKITSANGFEVGKRVTVKAAAVNGLGVLGKVATFTFKVGYAEADAIEFIDAPDELISGRKYTLTAKVLPAEANQKVLWKFENIEGCPNTKISANTGLLTTSAKDNGSITVTAYSPENEDDAYKTINIDIKPLDPTKKIVITSDNTSEAVTALKTAEFFINSTEKSEPLQLYGVSYKASNIKTAVKDDNFTWTSSNTKVATVSDEGLVSAVGKGSATITCKAKDGTNIKSSLTVTVRVCADSLSISGLSTVAPGKSTRYTAVFNPKATQYKTAFWWIEDTDGQGVTINPLTGKETVPKDAESGKTFTVCVTSGLADCAKRTIKINSANAQVKIVNNDSLFAGLYKQANDGVLKEATIFATDAFNKENKHFDTIQLGVKDSDSVYSDMIWTSSSPKVAAVDENGVVTALSVGKATITCKASDVGGKSHSVRIVVVNPASDVTVVTKEASLRGRNGMPTLSSGKSVRNTVTLGDAYGTPTIKKVTWDFAITAVEFDAKTENCIGIDTDRKYTDYANANRLISINKSTGQLTASKSALSSLRNEFENDTYVYNFIISAIAYSTDGSLLYGGETYDLSRESISKLCVEYNGRLYTNLKLPKSLTVNDVDSSAIIRICREDGSDFNDCTVKSSNPDVAAAIIPYNGTSQSYFPYVQIIPGQKAGTATITVTAADGSNKKATIKVTVK